MVRIYRKTYAFQNYSLGAMRVLIESGALSNGQPLKHEKSKGIDLYFFPHDTKASLIEAPQPVMREQGPSGLVFRTLNTTAALLGLSSLSCSTIEHFSECCERHDGESQSRILKSARFYFSRNQAVREL